MPEAEPMPAAWPLVAYAEDLYRGARVLLVGNALSDLSRQMLERGARLVHVCDEDSARCSEARASASDGVSFGSLSDGPNALREGFFDLVLIENLSAQADAAACLGRVARLMAPRGVVLVVSPNPEASGPLLPSPEAGRPLDYYGLYDLVADRFPHVHMFGQMPFVGYAVVDFGADQPSPGLDTSLVSVPGEEPDYFVAVACRQRRSLEEYSVIQLPTAALRAFGPNDRRPSVRDQDASRLQQQETWIAELEERAAAADGRADTAEAELDEIKERVGNLDQARRASEKTLAQERDALRAKVSELSRRVGELEELSTDQAAKLGEFEELSADQAAKLGELSEQSADSAEVVGLEAQLAERAKEIRRLESELIESERTGRELVRRLSESAATTALGPSPESAELAQRLLEARAELVGLGWAQQLLQIRLDQAR